MFLFVDKDDFQSGKEEKLWLESWNFLPYSMSPRTEKNTEDWNWSSTANNSIHYA